MIFSRRQMHSMLTDLVPHMRSRDLDQLANNLDETDQNVAISAMWELVTRWSFARILKCTQYVTSTKSSKNPEMEIDLGLGRPIVVDVKSLSGDTFEFAEHLRKATNSIKSLFDEISPNSENSFEIHYHELYNYNAHIRRRPYVCVDPAADVNFRDEFIDLIKSGESERFIKIPEVIAARFVRAGYKSDQFRYWTSIPPLIQRAKNTQSDRVVKQAKKQLGPFSNTHYRGLILCDGGTSSLGKSDGMRDWMNSSSGEMVQYIVDESGIDFAFAVGREEFPDLGVLLGAILLGLDRKKSALSVTMHANSQLDKDVAERINSELSRALHNIPTPRFQLRSAKEQMRNSKRSGRKTDRFYLDSQASGQLGGMNVTLKISANAFVDFLKGKISESEFRTKIGLFQDRQAPFFNLDRMKIADIAFEPMEDRDDDDYIVITLVENWSETEFRDIVKRISASKKRKNSQQQ